MKSLRTSISATLAPFAAVIAKIAPFSFIVGSQAAFFTLGSGIIPAIGFIQHTGLVTLVMAIRIALRILMTGSILTSALNHIPTYAGALWLSHTSRIAKLVVPLLCIILFVAHPTGAAAYMYSFYWIIPLIVAVSSSRSIFLQALGSTFTTHAVGSVIWLYTRPMTALQFNALISVVWYERLLLALAMTATYYACNYLYELGKQTSASSKGIEIA